MKIAIIKLGALGDVVRTLPVAEAIKKKYPNAELLWITKKNALELFEGNPFVNNVFAIPFKTSEEFDILYNFDIEEEAIRLAGEISADKKYGFYLKDEYPAAFNLGAEYYLNTLFDDKLKKENKKTYQEMMFLAAELQYNKEMPRIYLSKKDMGYANNFVKTNNIDKNKLIGIHIGSSPRWPSKAWGEKKIKEFIIKAGEIGFNVILFAGPDEKDKPKKLVAELKKMGVEIYHNNQENSVKEFAALVNECKIVVCSDSFALHIALALKKPVIGLFFCTSPHEVEEYGLLKKIVSPLLYDFFPEKQDRYNEELVNSISSDEVLGILN